MDNIMRLDVTSPAYLAKSHISAKFDGIIPETVTMKECIELMLAFSEYESKRAAVLERECRNLLAIMPTPPIVIPR